MDNQSANLFRNKDNFELSKEVFSIPVFETQLRHTPLITVAIPTFKRVDLLKQALESVINQENAPYFDIIVVDNNPKRNCETEKLLTQFKNHNLSYYKNSENLQMVGNWNRLYTLAKGDFVIMLHDDDLLYPDCLNKINKVLHKLNFNLDVIYTPWNIKDKNIVQNFPFRKLSYTHYIEKLEISDFLWGNIIGPPIGMCLRKSKMMEIGGFDMEFYPSLDYAFYVKFAKKFKCLKITGHPLWVYRIEDNESLKTETLINFVKADISIKHSILNEIKYNNSLIIWNKYFNVFVYHYLRIMVKLFQNNEIDVNRVLTNLGYKYNILDYLIFRIMNIYKSLYFKIRRKKLFK